MSTSWGSLRYLPSPSFRKSSKLPDTHTHDITRTNFFVKTFLYYLNITKPNSQMLKLPWNKVMFKQMSELYRMGLYVFLTDSGISRLFFFSILRKIGMILWSDETKWHAKMTSRTNPVVCMVCRFFGSPTHCTLTSSLSTPTGHTF